MMKTSTGFEFEYDKSRLNNMELLDAFSELEESGDEESAENVPLMSRIITLMLGKEAKKRLYDFIRDDGGKVPPERFCMEVIEIFKAMESEIKKSSSLPE